MDSSNFPPSAEWSAVMPSYEWPRNTDEQDIDYVYHGRMENLPRSTSKIVRIFLSSTFTDTYTERNLLMKNVFPEMRKYCRDKYDLDFQVVDMRWGIREDATVDHSASELCMKEIKTCNELSLGPTFVTLLSHRYGSRPLRTRIPEQEMNILIEELNQRSAEDVEFVLQWYNLDTNAQPPEYILKPLVKFEEIEKFIDSEGAENDNESENDDDTKNDDDTENDDVTESNNDAESDDDAENEDDAENDNDTGNNNDAESDDDVENEDDAENDNDAENEDNSENHDDAYRDKHHVESQKINAEKYIDLLKTGNEKFRKVEAKLKQIFKELALNLLKEKRLTVEQAEKYYISVTEEEIIEGIRKNERRRDRCLAFVRQLNDINLSHEKAWRFIDKTEDGKLDEEAQDLMTILRDKTIPGLLPPENIFRFGTTWSNNEGVNEKDHAEYLEQFCDTFKRALADQIDRGVKASKFTSDKLFSEILEHCHQCVAKVERFYGREQILDTIRNYIMSGSEQPLIIWGESGCGKTSVLAKAAKMVPEWLGDNKDLIIPVRFLGTTPESSTIYQTLASISQQIIKLCALEKQFPELPQEFADLKDIFRDILAVVPDRKRVVLFLDSLDQLAETNSAHQLHWFPQTIPKKVKIVVSVLPKEHGILDKLRSMLKDKNLYVEVPNIKTETSHEILNLWLNIKKRKLSEAQEKLVNELLKREVRPLYLKLVFDEIHAWKSYEQPTFNCLTIEACLARLYKRIETKHGQVLVSKALGYLSASTNGLTELEIEDILSLDEEVLNDVFQFHIPPIRRLPSILWARIRRDLDEYIVDREADGTKVMAWYHRQFIQEANKRYLEITGGYYGNRILEQNVPLYKNMCDYFAGIWADDKPKPFVYSDWHCKKLNLANPNSEAVRHVSAQPSIFTAPDGSIDIENPRYNLRKISELPEACKNVLPHKDIIEFICKHIVLNPEFLCAWIKNKPWIIISGFITSNFNAGDYSKKWKEYSKIYKKQFEGTELTEEEKNLLEEAEDELKGSAGLALQMTTIHQCLLLSYIAVLNNPTILGADVSGRLLVYRGNLNGIDEWINYCDTKGRELCALVSPHLQLETPGSELLLIITNHDGPVRTAMWASDETHMCISLSSKFVAVSMEMGQVLIDTRPRSIPKGDYFKCALASDQAIIACLAGQPWIYFFNDDGDVVDLIKLEEELEEKFKYFGHAFRINSIHQSELIGEQMAYIHFVQLPYLVFLSFEGEVKKNGVKMQFSVVEGTDTGCIVNTMEGEDNTCMYILDGHPRVLKLELEVNKETRFVSLKSREVVHNFLGYVFAHNVVHNSMIVGISDGSIYILNDKYKELHIYQFTSKTETGDPKYGHVSFVKLHKPRDARIEKKLLSVACTTSHLLLLIPKCYLTEDGSSTDSDSESETDYELKLAFRVKRRYDMAEISPGRNLIIAARGGTVDLFQLDEPHNHTTITGRFFTSIDAHAREITNILPTNEDILFITSSMDGTLKFWMVARAGVTRKYIPNFDKADVALTQVMPDEETALASGPGANSVLEWNILKGRISKVFPHSSKHVGFRYHGTDKVKSKLFAIDEKGTLFFWDLRKPKGSASRKKSMKRKTTPKHGVEEVKRPPNETPTAVFDLQQSIPEMKHVLDLLGNYGKIYVVNNGLVITVSEGPLFHVQIDENVHVEKVCDFFASFWQWKINDRYILESDAKVLRLYDAQNKVLTNTFVNEENVGRAPHGLKYCVILNKTDELLVSSPAGITLWNPILNSTRKLEFECKERPEIVTSESGVCLVHFQSIGEYRGLKINSDQLSVEPWIRKFSESVNKVEFLTLTHDGKYILYVINKKMLHLRRYSDGKLLALYTMHDGVCSLSVSTNNWFVVLGTDDKRLFTLVIADPKDREHDDRIAYVRTMNPGLSMEHAMALMGEANTVEGISDYDSSDDEALMRAAERRLNRRATGRYMVFCLQSDEPSSDSESETRPGKKQVLTRESSVVQVYDNALQPTAHDGEIFTPSPCSLQ